MNRRPTDGEKYPWAGPALFCVVLIGIVAFFWWFLF